MNIVIARTTLCCRRLSPEQSQASAEALHSIAPDDAFVIDMIKHWWHPAALTTPADGGTSTQGQCHSQAPLDAAKAGQGQGQQPFEAFTAGHPQAATGDQLADKLQTDRARKKDSQQGLNQSPSLVTQNIKNNQAESMQLGGPRTRAQGSFEGSRYASDSSSAAKRQLHVEQRLSDSETHSTDHPDHPGQQAEAAKAISLEPTAESANTGAHSPAPVIRHQPSHVLLLSHLQCILCHVLM